MFIKFTPTRLITGGAGKLEAKLKRCDLTDKDEGKEAKALSGRLEYTVYRIERELQCQTVPLRITSAQLAEWREFKNSCAFGEFFTFDPFGTEAVADDPQRVQLKFKSFKEHRERDGRFVFSFTTVQVIG